MEIPGDQKLNFEYKLDLKSSLFPVEDKVQYRRKRVLELRAAGFTNVDISHILKYSLSTVEKDIQKAREDCKENEIIRRIDA